MRISASIRPRGLKKGVSTEKFYREGLHYKGEHGPDIRDVVGHLELDAYSGQETLLFAAFYRLFGGYNIGDETRLVIYDKGGKELFSYERTPEEDSNV